MIAAASSIKSPFDESVRLLVGLHELMTAGKDESEDADRIREQMDAPWYAMSHSEQQRVRGLSADLYTISSDSSIVHSAIPNYFAPELLRIIKEKLASGQFDAALELLRNSASDVSLQRATMIRGLCYEYLGLIDVAELFFRFAAEYEGWSGDATTKLLIMIDGRGHLEEAVKQASHFLTSARSPSPPLLLYAAFLFAKFAFAIPKEQALNSLSEAKSLTERAVLLANATPQKIQLATGPLHATSVAYWHFDENRAALDVVERTIQLFPSDGIAYTIRGMIKEAADDSTAVDDFRVAIGHGTPFAWPYARLALKALEDGEFDEFRQLSRMALQFATGDLARANILEWMAIAALLGGEPTEVTRGYFAHALKLAPGHSRIVRNSAVFEASINGETHDSSEEMIKEGDGSAFNERASLERTVRQFAFA